MPRSLYTAASFVVILVAYWVYSALAVPWIEPSLEADPRRRASAAEIDQAASLPDRPDEELAALFPPGSWQLDKPIMLKSDQLKLLVGQYDTLSDGRVKLWPCTIVFISAEPDDPPEERRRRTTVLEAPEALLRFDKPFDLSQMQIGHLVDGQLVGEITIRGAGRPDDPSDDLAIVTRDVQLSREHVWTPHAVAFRLGPSFGQGREMHLRFGEAQANGRRGGNAPRMGALEAFELAHVDRLHVEVPLDDKTTPGAASPSRSGARPSIRPGTPADASVPVDIACQGPFVLDVLRREATFEDRVHVVRTYPDGPGDSLTCAKLTILLAPRANRLPPGAAPAQALGQEPPPPGLADLEPVGLKAEGQPVVIQSPQKDAYVQGQRVEYDLLTGRILLEGQEPVFLRQGVDQCQAVQVEYQPPGKGHAVGQIAAAGPGWFRGQMADRPGQSLEAQWTGELRLQPHEQQQRLSLTGGAALNYGGVGHLSAGEIHFFINEVPSAKEADPPQLAPDRMLAKSNVHLDSPQLTGVVDELNVWFKPDPAAPGGYAARIDTSGPTSGTASGTAAPGPQAAGPGPYGADAAGANPAASLGPAAQSPPPATRFHLTGRLLQVEILLAGNRATVNRLIVAENVQLQQTQTEKPDQQPVNVRGDWIEVCNASSPAAATFGVTGRPARFDGGGLGLTGETITLNNGTNLLKIEGPGFMDLPPMDRDLQGRPMPGGGPVRIHWQQRMEFNGRTARFEQSVVAASALQQLRTDALDVSFRQMIRFADYKSSGAGGAADQPDVESLRCQGGVRMDGRSVDKLGQLVSVQSIETNDLAVNNLTGELAAAGPGWLRRVGLGRSPLEDVPGLARPASGPPASPSASTPTRPELTYLHVQFLGSITGNVHRNEIAFHDRVQAVYGPIPTWQSTLPDDDPDALGPRGVQLTCEHLNVVEMPSPTGGDDVSVELVASHNARVRSQRFTAWGHQISYDDRKGLLILKGDGRTDAFLSYQTEVGGPEQRISGREFLYWPQTQQIGGDGIQSLEVEQFSLPKESRP